MIAAAGHGLAAIEVAMRNLDRPPPVVSTWRATVAGAPRKQLVWHGQKWQLPKPGDFVVVLTCGVEYTECLPNETIDNAPRHYNRDVRVVTPASRDYS